MYLSLILALLTYLLSPKGTPAEQRSALLKAAAVGGATYLATEYTDWGKDISDKFDGAIGVKPTLTTEEQLAKDERVALETVTGNAGTKAPSLNAPSSWWDSVKNWVPTALGVAGGAAIGSGVPGWAIALGIGAIVYAVLT